MSMYTAMNARIISKVREVKVADVVIHVGSNLSYKNNFCESGLGVGSCVDDDVDGNNSEFDSMGAAIDSILICTTR